MPLSEHRRKRDCTETKEPRGKRGRQRSPPQPQFVAPELATLVDQMPAGENWLYEVKYDGYRLESVVSGGRVTLLTRNGLDWTDRFVAVARAVAGLDVETAVLDGEVVAFEPSGRTSFRRLQQNRDGDSDSGLAFVVFDLLFHDGHDLCGLPLADRRARLERIVGGAPWRTRRIIRVSESLSGSGPALLREVCRRGLEGVICKRLDRPYQSGRTRSWLKVKCSQRQEFVVLGFTQPKRSRVAIGSLLLGVRDRSGYRYAGRVGTGMPNALLRDLLARLEPLASAELPVLRWPPRVPRDSRWVQPKLVVEVEFTEWTDDGLLRHPSLIGLREDKEPGEVRRETTRGIG
jgi:bifunctional non-homologous end joining protein LigD